MCIPHGSEIRAQLSMSISHLHWYHHWNAIKFALDADWVFEQIVLCSYIILRSQKGFDPTLNQINYHSVPLKRNLKSYQERPGVIEVIRGCTIDLFCSRLDVTDVKLKDET